MVISGALILQRGPDGVKLSTMLDVLSEISNKCGQSIPDCLPRMYSAIGKRKEVTCVFTETSV